MSTLNHSSASTVFYPPIRPHPFCAQMSAGGIPFKFELWGRESRLGEGAQCVEIDQLWMDVATLYPQRGRVAVNHGPVTDYFWAKCLAAGEPTPAQQDIYLLAKLLPFARAHGSRRVLPDAIPSRSITRNGSSRSTATLAEDLERILSCAVNDSRFGLGSVAFRDRTADALACPRYDQNASFCAAYQEFTTAWLDRGRSGLMAGDQRSLTATLDQWQVAMRGWGRRRGQQLGKEVLNALSYECRAAFHRCYTVVWQDLSFHLATHWGLDEPSQRFIQLWHLDRSSPTDDPAVDFHLFHGHVFGLHPGSGLVMQTPTGRTLVADFVRARTAEEQVEPYRRILAAIELAVHIYMGGLADHAESRRKRPGTSSTQLDVRTSSGSRQRSHRIASDRSRR